ncbi:hypothetical protein Fcan01_01172 [Folsomia candida]|uniref:CRAL-TRIO domain-containing protein n=2 Tax=Folsomia candida TaxID=158441 RepID=A0A226F0B1_FOLCA|nr:hypothetical protein Fcan01_01172 [Folsomia candida]
MFSNSKILNFATFIILINLVGAAVFEKDVNLTMDQKALLDKFKIRMADKLPHEYMQKEIYLVKWLRSSNFNLDQAEERLLKNLEWRKEQNMDTIHSEDWSDMWGADFRYFTEGRDKLGRPFMVVEMLTADPRKIVLQGNGDRLVRYVDKAIDEACQLVQELGEKYGNMTRGNAITNLDGFSLIKHGCIRCLPFLIRNVVSFSQHWPECVDKMIFVNAPTEIEQILTLARPLVSEETRENMFVYGTNKKVWMEALRQDFDLDQLPPSLGGTKIYKGMDKENFDY